MTDIISIMPKMLTGEELDKALEILPEYDESIRDKSVPERLVALQDIYKIYVPSNMTREIYTKMYLSLLRFLQKICNASGRKQHVKHHRKTENACINSNKFTPKRYTGSTVCQIDTCRNNGCAQQPNDPAVRNMKQCRK